MIKKLRLIIERITPQYLHCFSSPLPGDEAKAKRYVVDYSDGQFLYLKKILKSGMQINILDATQLIENAVVFPQHIIVEPDFLVDISSIAGCFKEYGHHALNYIVSRLSKPETSQPILLGNYAGAALDEIISRPPLTPPQGGGQNRPGSNPSPCGEVGRGFNFAKVLTQCFQSQPLEFITCPKFNGNQFKQDAIKQASNIQEIVAALKEKYDLDKAILEPTFVCEALGLQGRVDMMTTDLKLLIEQKSGKNFNLANSRISDIGYHVESHYVQLLLYFSVLYFNFGVKREDIDFYLLYSKYEMPTGLLPVDYYEVLINEALKLRNQIVATELMVADKGFGKIRPLLRTDVVNVKRSQSNLWRDYQCPQLEEQFSIYNNLFVSKLLYAYFDTMATFVYREQRAAWLGESTEQSTAVSYLWKMTLEEKIDTGNILAPLTDPLAPQGEKDPLAPQGGTLQMTLSLHKNQCTEQLKTPPSGAGGSTPPRGVGGPLPNFRRGDSVYLYQYTDIPDVRKAFLHKANIIKMTSDEIVLSLKNPIHLDKLSQNNENDEKTFWAIEHSASNSSTSSSLRSLTAFLKAEPERQELILGQREPQADLTKTLTRSYSEDYDDIVLRMKQAKDYFLLIGPPGTGKTSQALKFMVQESLDPLAPQGGTFNSSADENKYKSSEIITLKTPPRGDGGSDGALLLLSYTNRAVDEICEMLDGAGIDFLRIGNEFATDEQWLPHLLNIKARENSSLAVIKADILNAKVIVGTTSTISSRTYLFTLKHFSLAIIDESSQILEPNIIGILSQDIDKFVLIGDYKQLPAVVQQSPEESKVTSKELNDICLTDCRNSLFERLINIERKAGRTQFIGLLRKQGRMHPDIAEFANEHFYKEENLQPVPLPHQLEESGGRMLFHDIKKTDTNGNDKANIDEAIVAAKIVDEVRKEYEEAAKKNGSDGFNPRKTVGIIVPYRNQIATVRSELEKYGIADYSRISIDTVERYQGSQRDVIIYSFTISKEHQLGFLTANTFYENNRPIDRKLNVALTRARKKFIALGNKELLSKNYLFKKLIESCKEQ
ncbi:MAG: AAA domain-containing protein [Bacteroidaceae bacterium]|nr:AAA domain-containing protein [Bacteroidaceae bacterium]